MTQHATCGIEIGGTWMRVAVVEKSTGKLLHSRRAPTPADPDEGIRQLSAIWESVGAPKFFGFASAAQLEQGQVERWPSQPRYVGSNLLAAFASADPVCLDDASAGAYSEHNRSSEAGPGSSVYISLGTGVGGGAVLAGKLWQGHHGTAMDIGHVPVPAAAAAPCSCGSVGCVQAIASGRALQKENGTTREQRLTLAAQGIGELAVQLSRILDCPLYILGGGVLEAEPGLFDSIAERARRSGVRARFARGILGASAGAVGAAEFASAAHEM